MKHLMKLSLVGLVIVLVSPMSAPAQESVPLMAGQHTNVGSVNVFCTNGELTINFNLIGGYCLVETHQYVDSEAPKKNAPGRFTYKHEDLFADGECVAFDQYLADGVGLTYLASHAVVCEDLGLVPNWEGYENTIDWAAGEDGLVTINVSRSGTDSYFRTTITNGSDLNGTFDGWCIDTDRTINPGSSYEAVPVPAYIVDEFGNVTPNPQLVDIVEYPENFDQVAWIINQGFVGQDSTNCGGVYTYGDQQRAIWSLIEDQNSTSGVGSWSQCRVDEILAAATQGAGFIPGCNQLVPVILVPVNPDYFPNHQITIAQVTFAEIDVPCQSVLGDCETAWGLWGPDWQEFRNSWGQYYSVSCGSP